jgi:MoaA/NifB/PqqE/SkfB family radical SAM enzyme
VWVRSHGAFRINDIHEGKQIGVRPAIDGRESVEAAGEAAPVERARGREVDLRLVFDDRCAPVWRRDPAGGKARRSLDEIVSLAESLRDRGGAFLLDGRGLLQRADALEIVAKLAAIRPERLGIATGGDGLTAAAASKLAEAGVERALVPLCCGRQDANDWLMRKPGALKLAGRTIRALAAAGIPVTAEVMVTRPSMRHLAETVEILARLGVRSVVLRRLTQGDVEPVEFVPLSPRMDLLPESLEKAATVALERRMALTFRDFPLCAAPRLRPLFAVAGSEVWIDGAGNETERSPRGMGCAACPRDARCAGAPLDYVQRFGWEEFADPTDLEVRLRDDVAQQQAPVFSEVMAFSWRSPRRVRCDACAATDDAPGGADQGTESTRVIRARLVEAARYRPAVFRLVGADLLAHPEAPRLLYDAVRLFPAVEAAGEASPVVDWTDLDLRRIKDLSRFDVAIYGPDANAHDAHCGIPGSFAATMRAVERLRDEAGIEVGSYAILHDAAAIARYAAAWNEGGLPGPPRFRLSGDGGSLDELCEVAATLPAGAVRDALAAVLPRCGAAAAATSPAQQRVRQRVIKCGRSVTYRPCGSDPVGAFEFCQGGEDSCEASDCPGTAVGWRSTARSKRWTVNT